MACMQMSRCDAEKMKCANGSQGSYYDYKEEEHKSAGYSVSQSGNHNMKSNYSSDYKQEVQKSAACGSGVMHKQPSYNHHSGSNYDSGHGMSQKISSIFHHSGSNHASGNHGGYQAHNSHANNLCNQANNGYANHAVGHNAHGHGHHASGHQAHNSHAIHGFGHSNSHHGSSQHASCEFSEKEEYKYKSGNMKSEMKIKRKSSKKGKCNDDNSDSSDSSDDEKC